MRWRGKLWLPTSCHVVRKEEHSLAHLRNPKICGVEESVVGSVSHFLQHFTHLFGDIVSAIVEDVWDVLDEHGQRLEVLHVVQISNVQIAPVVLEECLGMLCNLPQLRATNPSKCLAR